MAAWLGDTFGWRTAFFAIAAIGGVGAIWVYATVPRGIRPAALSLAAWRGVFADPVLMAMVLVTALAGAGQFTLFSYFAPYCKAVLGASTTEIALLFRRLRDLRRRRQPARLAPRPTASAPARAVLLALLLMAVSLLAWPLAQGVAVMGVVLVPWALACFSCQSLQQARLKRHRAGPRAGPDGAQLLGDLPGPGRWRFERRLAHRPTTATAA